MARLTEKELRRYVIDEVLRAAAVVGVPVREMTPEEVCGLRCELSARFGNHRDEPLTFESMAAKAAVQDEHGWRRLGQLLDSGAHQVFYDHSHDNAGAEVADGTRIPDVLSECFGFPFYVVDRDRTFVVGMNDHDYLIGVGAAADWIRSYRR